MTSIDRADRRTGLADFVEIERESLGGLGIGREERIAVDFLPIPVRAVDLLGAHGDERAADAEIRDDLAGNGAGGDPRRGFARRGTPAAAIVADAVFHVIGEIRMARPVAPRDVGIVLRALVGVLDHHADRRSRRHQRLAVALGHHAGEHPHRIVLAPLRREFRLPRLALVQIGLNLGLGEADARRAAVDHAAKRDAVALAPGGDSEKMAEGVVRHEKSPFCARF